MTQQDCPRKFRALCVELVDAYAWCIDNYMSASPYEDSLVQRAHAALAQPEPKEPTDEELLQVFDTVCLSEGGTVDEIHLRGLHAVLARWGK
jgi:hypothetical protein